MENPWAMLAKLCQEPDEMMHLKRNFMFVMPIILAAIAGLHIAANTSAPASAQIHLHPTGNPIPPIFFGMHIHHMLTGAAQPTPWPAIPFGSWRLWDAGVAWPALEPEKGKWNFTTLDKYVAMADEHHVEILLTLGLTPPWASARPEEKSGYSPGNAAEPKNISDWQDFVRTVATRYKGRVHYYEIWNEPNFKQYYTGTPEEMVTLVAEASKILREVDPWNRVVSPSASTRSGLPWLEQFLQQGGAKYVNIIGYHFYVAPNPPETMIDTVAQVRVFMEKYGIPHMPLWDSETGWAIANRFSEVQIGNSGMGRVLSESEAEAYVARAYILLWASGVDRFYYYSWDSGVMGLTEKDATTTKAPARAYATIENWLVGAKMLSCESNADGTWVSELSRQGNYHGWIVWNTTRTANFTPPASWRVKQARDLAGKTEPLQPGSLSIPIGPSPLLLESQAP
jgi:hypothetical protein